MKDLLILTKDTLTQVPWLGHVFFWVLYWLGQSVLMSKDGELAFYLSKNLAMVSIQVLLVYFNLFVLIPYLYLKRRSVLYILLSAALIYLAYTFSFRWIQFVLACMHKIFPSVHLLTFPPSMLTFQFEFWRVFSGSVPYSLAFVCSTAYHFIKSDKQKEKEKAWLAMESNKAELKFLKSKISPHFLFNSLNNLHYLIGKDQELSKSYTLKLSDILRYIVYESKEDKVVLEAEVNHLKSYVDLMKISIENPNKITFKESGDFHSHKISPLILLSVIENGFKHSGITYDKNANLCIDVALRNQKLFLEMKNTIGKKIKTESNKSDSLENLKKRLELIYLNKHEFYLNLGENEALTTLMIQLD